MISSDIKRIQQVFLSIFTNAVKFTDRNGSIKILVELLPNDFLKISTTDNGIGIKKKN